MIFFLFSSLVQFEVFSLCLHLVKCFVYFIVDVIAEGLAYSSLAVVCSEVLFEQFIFLRGSRTFSGSLVLLPDRTVFSVCRIDSSWFISSSAFLGSGSFPMRSNMSSISSFL